MKYALISPSEKISVISEWNELGNDYTPICSEIGARIAEVSATRFDVAEPLFWVSCLDEIASELFCYDGNSFVTIPMDLDCPPSTNLEQPAVGGAETL